MENNNITRFTGDTEDMIERVMSQEIIPIEERIDSIAYTINSGELPVHLQELHKLNCDSEQKELLLSLYIGTEPKSLNTYINKTVNIQGAIIHYHPPFKAKDNSIKDGYYRVLLLTDIKDEDGCFVVLSTSSRVIGEHMLYAMMIRGWYIWEKSVPYRFSKDASGAFRMVNMLKISASKKGKENG